MRVRLPKVLARAGISSRRKAEDYIREGRVIVKGELVIEPGALVDPETDHIKVDGRRLRKPAPPIYLLLNKPRGVVTSLRDPQGRPTVVDLLKGFKARVFPVGRLDYDSEGLLLLTNDGELAQRLVHPRYGVERSYLVKVKGVPQQGALDRLREGIRLEPGLKVRGWVRMVRALKANAWLEVTLREGRHREVRRMCEAVGHPVLILRRIRFGPLTLEGLPAGRHRHLTEPEVRALRKLAASRGRVHEKRTKMP